MVEDVEKLHAQIEGKVLLDHRVLRYTEVRIVEARTVEETPVGGPERAKRTVLDESASGRNAGGRIAQGGWHRGNKIASRVTGSRTIGICIPGIQSDDLADEIRHIRCGAASQRIIALALVHLYGEACREARDPLHLPSLG